MVVYRAARLVILNATSGALTVEAAEVLQGEWRSADGLTARGGGIDPQAAAALDCTSAQLQVGCEAFLRLATSTGMIHLHWEMPWVGRFDLRVDLDVRRWSHEVILMAESPACPTALLILSPPNEQTAPSPAPRRRR